MKYSKLQLLIKCVPYVNQHMVSIIFLRLELQVVSINQASPKKAVVFLLSANKDL